MSDNLIVPTYTVAERIIQNSTNCIPIENFTAILPSLALKTDAIKLGVACFIAGMVLMYVMLLLDNWWKK